MEGDIKLEHMLRTLYETNVSITGAEIAAICPWARSCYRMIEIIHESNAGEMEIAFGLNDLKLEGCKGGCGTKKCRNRK